MVSLLALLQPKIDMMNLNNIFESKLNQFAPLENKVICVALSGGADSVCLLHLLNQFSNKFGYRLIAAHVNHNLREQEATRDAAFCYELCKTLNININLLEINVSEHKLKGESVEEAARRLRYEALNSINYDYLATAHHSDDNIETFLINLIRGTGIKGLCGIPEKREKIIRPLLNFSKDNILNYCKANGLTFVTDSTNLSDDYTRNFLRHKVVPIFKKINPSFNDVFCRSVELLKQDEDYLTKTAKAVFEANLSASGLDISNIANEHYAILSRVLRIYCKKVTDLSPDTLHISEFIKIIKLGRGSYQFKNGYTAFVKNKSFYLEKNTQTNFSVNFEIVSVTDINNYLKVNNLLLKNIIDYDKICGELVLRTRCEGDKLKLFQKKGTKALRRLQQEYDVPSYNRTALPVAADDKGAIWCHLIGTDCRVKPDGNTKRIVVFNVIENF